ncbi:16S rRNA (cytosine(967)-C(5))-methyltransferase RsmB [Anaeromicropila populeti]|uniref:16S rRNA (cytosine(967)-C(5))-methyltransferase n=1 Tax=Anaeromicropila populeti TaxID=37658 RepID=A0A1I6KWK4_9FIRM|nr:16S rRNA (cytosine(967)-C(5))-methyltransferase RsmB [Anaeromicropila populeti]SFR95606.1 16S rRNA (cytosine967-C5)-methyltransferase [Anaeromicropila populeti]
MTTKETKAINVRELALEIVTEVLENQKALSEVIHGVLDKYQYLPKQERAFLTRLSEGTIETAIELDYIIEQFSTVKIKKMKTPIRNILRMGVYQLKYMNQVPASAACNESVKLAAKKGFHNLKGFVNGILRNVSGNIEKISYPSRTQNIVKALSVSYSMPEWILEMWNRQMEREQIEKVLKAFLEERKTVVRCNTEKITANDFKNLLLEHEIIVEDGAYCPTAFRISNYDTIRRIPGFQEGYFIVQDESSMLSVLCAGIEKENHVMDVCAAPGGKTLFAAELLKGTGKILSYDISQYKVDFIEENKKRLGINNVETGVQDASVYRKEYEQSQDIVIADLPCSGLGIIGNKPDIKYHCTLEGIHQLVDIQRKILSVVSQYVKKGGVLIYSTCTLNKMENIENTVWFQEQFDFELESLDPYLPDALKSDTTKKGYLTLLPGINKSDGFFIARFRKR